MYDISIAIFALKSLSQAGGVSSRLQGWMPGTPAGQESQGDTVLSFDNGTRAKKKMVKQQLLEA